MKGYKFFNNVAIHIIAWLLIALFNIVFLSHFEIELNILFHVVLIILYAFVFYTTYFLLTPMLFKKKISCFVFCSLLLFFIALLVKGTFTIFMFEKLMLPKYSDFAPHHFRKPPPFQGAFDENMPKPFFVRKGLLVNFYGILLVYLFGVLIYFLQKWQGYEKQKIEMEKDKLSMELTFLKQQINPHFVFNSLNSIYSLSISKSELTSSTILKFSSILRYVLYESENAKVFLKEELDFLNDYVELQKLRLTNKVRVEFEIIGDTENHKIESVLLVPFFENAFKYGVDNVNNSFIAIKILIDGHKLFLFISNKIVVFPLSNKNDSGIGIKNIKRRLEILYPGSYSLNISNNNDVFSIILELNLKP